MTDEKAERIDRNRWRIKSSARSFLQQPISGQAGRGAITAARFAQSNISLLLIIDLQIVSSLPVVEQGFVNLGIGRGYLNAKLICLGSSSAGGDSDTYSHPDEDSRSCGNR